MIELRAFERGVEPVLSRLMRGREHDILKFDHDEPIAERIEELAEKSTEGELSANERAEYQGYVRANKFLAILSRYAGRLRDGAGS